LFSAPNAPPNPSGHTQIDGPTPPDNRYDTNAAKALVLDYYETVHIAGKHERIRQYMAGDVQIRHEPGVRDGVAAFERDLAKLTRSRTIDEIVLLLGQGDFVFIAARGTHDDKPCAYIDLYRVETGKLVEHWGFPVSIPPLEVCRNVNGLL
jgi:predicted SnoaL-like aldol condensation-catalyzing enzyme